MGEKAWAATRRTCAQVMTGCFGDSLYGGIDLRVAPDYRRHTVLEVNAFGDLLPGVMSDGLDTYASEISEFIRQGRPQNSTPCATSVPSVSVVNLPGEATTTETQRTQRTHRENRNLPLRLAK
jgi:hypothetical protein